jgi:hypothetical protein
MSRPSALDLSRLRVLPLAERRSFVQIDDVLVNPASTPRPLPDSLKPIVDDAVAKIRAATERGASVMLLYGAHLLRNGATRILEQMMARGWLTHVATNGAGTIHDWEFAYLGRSCESVRDNVATGTFGTWDETGRNIHLALWAGSLGGQGYGQALGRFIAEDGTHLPTTEDLEWQIRQAVDDAFTPARAEVLGAMRRHRVIAGRHSVVHPYKHASILAAAFRLGVPATVHPGIGYDIIANHPFFDGSTIGRAAQVDFAGFGAAVDRLDGGVVLSVGSAIMGPQVFEKSLSCVHNLRFQEGRPAVSGHSIYVVDLQPGGEWDWSNDEPPKTHPAYYLRFCKSFARMGGTMRYLSCDNVLFMHHLYRGLAAS